MDMRLLRCIKKERKLINESYFPFMSAGLITFSCRFYDRLKVAHKFHSTQPKKTSSQTGEVLITDETEPISFQMDLNRCYRDTSI